MSAAASKKTSREELTEAPLDGQKAPPASLPPRPRHTFSLRTVEKLYQRHLESTGTHVRPEQIPTFVEDVRRGLARVAEVLEYRLQCPAASCNGGKDRLPLSRFERVRMRQILADVVLDIAIISIVGSGETHDSAAGAGMTVSLATSHGGVATPLSFNTEEFFEDRKIQEQESGLHAAHFEGTLELPEMPPLLIAGVSGAASGRELPPHGLALQPCASAKNSCSGARQVSPVAERLHYSPQWLQQSNAFTHVESHGNSSNSKPTQATFSSQGAPSCPCPLSHAESPLSPISLKFKPVLSMHSADDALYTFPQPRPRPRKQYDIDLMKVKEFTRCLGRVQELNLTDSEFEMLGLRYAIPGIRELDPSEAQFLACVGARCHPTGVSPPRSGDDVFVVRRTLSVKSTGGTTETGLHSTASSSSGGSSRLACASSSSRAADAQLPLQEKVAAPLGSRFHGTAKKHVTGSGAAKCGTADASPHSLGTGQCLPLFPGGKEVILEKKDLHLFLALVDARLKSVDQEVDGRLSVFLTDVAYSSGDEDTTFTA
ncbi:uncharacterized protein Tco025E_06310 [Trypanosoma conorhini]|uniref:Uncharacterized protein n=1 Tax=Trypanosoma conorhini TaxID=83891 RepID=A0A422P5Y6_9TRYP|nr:uncharacterized protein Tco025E_06310 [Trypanosoma conorhini]RNF13126.1 hypothetical protein Tco025E_06310 [Trypanosoma conorhini]